MIRLVAVVLLLAVACSASSDPVTAPETPVSTATASPGPTAAPSPPPTAAIATPSPESIPVLLEGRCPSSRAHALEMYTYEPAEIRDNDFFDIHCGPLLTDDECPDSRENAGVGFRYNRDAMSRQAAIKEYCGEVAARSNWNRIALPNGSDGAYTDTIFHDFNRTESVRLQIACADNSSLLVALFGKFGSMFPIRSLFLDVLYTFWNDGDVIEDLLLTEQVWLGDVEDGTFAGMPDNRTYAEHFVRGLRAHEHVSVTVVHDRGTNSATFFEIEEIDQDVEPVLQECGY